MRENATFPSEMPRTARTKKYDESLSDVSSERVVNTCFVESSPPVLTCADSISHMIILMDTIM